jgi:hypothetical protein
MITRRLKPLVIDGRVVDQIGLPIHWSFAGESVGGTANDLTSLVTEPNVSIHEAKAPYCSRRCCFWGAEMHTDSRPPIPVSGYATAPVTKAPRLRGAARPGDSPGAREGSGHSPPRPGAAAPGQRFRPEPAAGRCPRGAVERLHTPGAWPPRHSGAGWRVLLPLGLLGWAALCRCWAPCCSSCWGRWSSASRSCTCLIVAVFRSNCPVVLHS